VDPAPPELTAHPLDRVGTPASTRGRGRAAGHLLAAEGMVTLGMLSLDGTKLAGNAGSKANRTLPQIGKLPAEAAAADTADDARHGDNPPPAGDRRSGTGRGHGAGP
jgi:hypothetical protein